MRVIISDCSKVKVYHHVGCGHTKRLMPKHRMDVTKNEALINGYRQCKCCCNLKGSINALTTSLENTGKGRKMDLSYDKRTDTLFMRTEIGFWKTFWLPDVGLVLYHLNKYDKFKSTKALSYAPFHRQTDVKATESLEKILDYVENHDKAMQIIQDDYRKLPQKTKKQKKYFRQAKNRDRRMQIKRVFDIFATLDKERNAQQQSVPQYAAV